MKTWYFAVTWVLLSIVHSVIYIEPPKTHILVTFPAGISKFKVNKENTRKRCNICSELIINFDLAEYSGVSIVDFKQVNADWETVHCTKGFH